MKQAILYVCHGSRLKEACQEACQFIDKVKPFAGAPIQITTFLELSPPTIEEGFKQCVEKGATHIAVVPLLLLTAVHAKKDIPKEILSCMENYPGIHVTYGRPIGVHPLIPEVVIDRINERIQATPDGKVVLIGRGSSDPAVKKDLQEIAAFVQKKSFFPEVNVCFLTAAKPSFHEMLEVLKMETKPVYLVPYLLFTGLLMKDIEKEVRAINEVKDNLFLTNYIGFHPHLEKIFLDRVNETVLNEDQQFSFRKEEINCSH
ncbi:sirohydrochlorin chelatase [Metabacillus arenae]|uniref:Sirohydrochlorin chelatase n=1 Tax=Metabacillus arenae TaxID=2771434 RepID=A0A926NF63_9BACI|nr:sirohydrochlorin chelatase [Metabacillus arenae]MBD1379975.1 sirohydrochlorin chelatase [Metabacillus arenae]